MTIGERIKNQRKALKLTLADVSKKTNLSTGNLSELENDKYAPSVSSLLLLSKALRCSIDWLVTGEVAKNENVPVKVNEENQSDEFSLFSEIEHDIIMMFRELDERDKEDAFDSIKMKYDRTVKKGKATSLYSTYTGTQEDNSCDTNGSDSGIA